MKYSAGNIVCRLIPEGEETLKAKINNVEIFFAETKNFLAITHDLAKYLSQEETLTAGRLHFEGDRNTYIICHAVLRLILSARLNMPPGEIVFYRKANEKPEIKGNPVFFNISHTREAFVIAVSELSEIGVDLEKVKTEFNFEPVIRRFFGEGEQKYILEKSQKSRERFFLLWTRKESFLKAVGTGIINNLSEIEVSKGINHISRTIFETEIPVKLPGIFFISSFKNLDYFFSAAISARSRIKVNILDKKKIHSFLI